MLKKQRVDMICEEMERIFSLPSNVLSRMTCTLAWVDGAAAAIHYDSIDCSLVEKPKGTILHEEFVRGFMQMKEAENDDLHELMG